MSDSTGDYSPLSSSLEKEESRDLLSLPRFQRETSPSSEVRRTRWALGVVTPWLHTALTVILAATTLYLFFERQKTGRLGSYEQSFTTDLDDKVPLEIVTFTGSPHFNEKGEMWLPPIDENAPWPENVRYVGEPSPEVDENWHRLIGDRYFSVSPDEAIRAWGEHRSDYIDQAYGGYTAGLDVFHSLHCVNTLRKSLRPYYYKTPSDAHIDHCVNVLRQTIQCYGSTTLIPTKYREGKKSNYIDSDQRRVCRSFTHLRELVTSRAQGNESYVARDKSIVDPRKHRLAAFRKLLSGIESIEEEEP